MSKVGFCLLSVFLVFSANSSAQISCSAIIPSISNNFPNLPYRLDQPSELNRWRGGIRRAIGARFSSVKARNTKELADQMLSDRDAFDLIFKADKGLFTDLGIFNLLKTHDNIVTLKSGKDRTIHIAALNSGSFVVYLQHTAPHGEELSFVGSQIKTGAIMNWMKKNHPQAIASLVAAREKQDPLVLNLDRESVKEFSTEPVISSLQTLSRIHDILGNKDLDLALELTTFHNKLLKLNPRKAYSAEDVVEFYQLTKKELGFWGEDKEVRMLTFFGMLSDIQPKLVKDLFSQSSSFWGSTSDQMAIFMGVASQIKLDKVYGKLEEGDVSLATLEIYLEKHKDLYELAGQVTGFWTDNSLFTYVSAAISGKFSKFDMETFEQNAQYINKHADGDIDGPLLVYASTSKLKTVQQTVEDFNFFRKLTKDDDVALSLLAASQLRGQTVEKVTALYETASSKGEHIDSEELSRLLLSGMKAGLRPGQAIALLNEASAYTGGKLDEAELIPFAESIIGNQNAQATSITSDLARTLREQIAEEVRQAATTNLVVMAVTINSINTMNSSN